jgi:hypothetical protein
VREGTTFECVFGIASKLNATNGMERGSEGRTERQGEAGLEHLSCRATSVLADCYITRSLPRNSHGLQEGGRFSTTSCLGAVTASLDWAWSIYEFRAETCDMSRSADVQTSRSRYRVNWTTGTVIRLYDQHGDNLRMVGNPMNLLRQGCLPSEYWIGWGTALHSDGGRGDDHGNGRRNKKQF